MKQILVTRPKQQADQTCRRLKKMGLQALPLPLFDIIPVPVNQITNIFDSHHGLIITSQNAIPAAVELFRLSGKPKVYCYVVGKKTATKLTHSGFQVAAIAPDVGSLLTIIDNLAQKAELASPLLYLRGMEVSTDIITHLKDTQIRASEMIVYDTIPLVELPYSKIATAKTILFYSNRNAQLFAKLADMQPSIMQLLPNIGAISISNRVASTLETLPFKQVQTAESPDEESMLALLR